MLGLRKTYQAVRAANGPASTDYQKYLECLTEGNEPLPAKEAE